jgi:hypothetical protein
MTAKGATRDTATIACSPSTEACFARARRFSSEFTQVPYMLSATLAKLNTSAADSTGSPPRHPSHVPISCQSRSGFRAPSSA